MPTSLSTTILTIAIPSPLRRLFDYLPSADTPVEQLKPGMRVSVPFGHQKAVTGILIRISNQTHTAPQKMRAIHGLIDDNGLDDTLLSLCEWCAGYYHYPLGEVCHLALPALLRKPLPAPEPSPVSCWQLSEAGKQCEPGDFGRAKKQQALWELAQQHAIVTPELIKEHGISRSLVNTLLEKGILEVATDHRPKQTSNILAAEPMTLNTQQQQALDQIGTDRFSTYLLDGVTGSGKTEVYLQAIAKVIAQGKQALVLVPEIGLTPQTVERFKHRFAVPVSTLHSGMTDKQRLATWQAAKAGEIAIIIGTRSSVFTPLPQLGLIIVDEEHDLSYKQQEGVRYSARDVAIIRAQKSDIPIVLGSATPALETLHNGLTQRFTYLPLTKRATEAQLPIIRCVEQHQDSLSPEVISAIGHTLEQQQQVLVFINRRGYAPTLICQDCGWMSECESCDSRMTIHHFQQRQQHLHCHHCDHKAAVPAQCPHCHSSRLQPLGQGTQRSEEELKQHFGNTPILRIDRDSMSRKGEFEQALDIINSGQPCILVGTQMLAKGHHFANVSLAVMLGLDNSFFSSDFRGTERMAQLLTQVAGRAGREKHQGQVLIQTQFAHHPHLQTLIQEGYGTLAKQLLGERETSQMPPYQYMAFIRCHAQHPNAAMQFLQQTKQIAQRIASPSPTLQYLGPLAATMEKRNNRYYYQLQIKSSQRKQLHQVLAQLCQQLEQQRLPKGIHWLVDVDPQES